MPRKPHFHALSPIVFYMSSIYEYGMLYATDYTVTINTMLYCTVLVYCTVLGHLYTEWEFPCYTAVHFTVTVTVSTVVLYSKLSVLCYAALQV